MRYLLLALTLFASTQAFAALPPYGDSVRKIEAAMNSELVSSQLFGPFTTIRAVDALTYQISTAACATTVMLEAHPPGRPGPTMYSVKAVGKVVCE
jgi:hypothetical protein